MREESENKKRKGESKRRSPSLEGGLKDVAENCDFELQFAGPKRSISAGTLNATCDFGALSQESVGGSEINIAESSARLEVDC